MRTKKIENYSLLLSLVILLTGCKNALYFYETEKISLTAEARPDSSQPVQGSLAIKQRVVLIAPKKNEISQKCDAPPESDNCDAVSAITNFSFKIIPIDWEFNPVLIQTAFITGEAARNLKPNEARRAANAITLNGVKPPTISPLAKEILSSIKDDTDRKMLKQITARDFVALSPQDYKDILRITGLEKENYPSSLHEELRKLLSN